MGKKNAMNEKTLLLKIIAMDICDSAAGRPCPSPAMSKLGFPSPYLIENKKEREL